MGAITSSVGLISGINTGQIISALISEQSGPVTVLQDQVTVNSTISSVYQALSTQLQNLQTTAQSLEQPATYQAAIATSSNPGVLTANASNGSSVGTYNLQVAQLVSTQQLISTGFSDATNAKVGAGTITIDEGGGGLATQTQLSALNGGNGVGLGQFRITDRSGASSVIDASGAVTLDDVVNDINSADNISVRASIQNDHLVLTDTSGQTKSDLIVQDLGTGTTAADLGIDGDVASNTLTGTSINYLSTSTPLSQLNDGRGVTVNGTGDDLQINLKNGANFKVNLATASTVGDVITAINNASGGKLTASIPAGSSGIQLTDNTGGGGTLSVTAVGGSKAAADLGLTGAANGATLTGAPVIAGLDTTLLSSLNGGSGVPLGTVKFTNKAGTSADIDFSGASTVQDVLDDINNDTNLKLTATLNASGNGIAITDNSGGTGSLTIADQNGGTTAAAFGIAGTFANDQATVNGSNQHKQWVTDSTPLSQLNGGKGIDQTSFTISNSKGQQTTIDLDSTAITTVGDLLYQINSKDLNGVTAAINSTGNGIVLNDTSGGAGKLTVTDVNGTAASDLKIAGTSAGTGNDQTINGAYEKTVAVTANDTLTTLAAKINALGFGVNASVISDGGATNPYRLSLTATNSGTAGQVVFDDGTTSLGTSNLVNAQDAAVYIGGTNTGKPLLVTSSTNQVTDVIPGVTINLQSVSSGPVQLNIAADPGSLESTISTFVSTFNNITAGIGSQTTFNSSSNQSGILLGDPVATQIVSTLFNSLETTVNNGGSFKVLSEIGITVGSNNQLSFDTSTFEQAFAQDTTAVQQLFTSTATSTNVSTGKITTTHSGIAYAFDTALTQLDDPISGVVTNAINTLATESQGFQTQITQLNAILAEQQATLESEFANMESVLANLKSQGAALGSIDTVATSDTSSSSSNSSSSSSSG
jgi:flagellar hook-associated protein 2